MSGNKITFVIILYNLQYDNSKTIQNLLNNNIAKKNILIIDNSTNKQIKKYNASIDSEYIYVDMNGNSGISKAYNKAIELVTTEWIVFLDQDTNISIEYLKEIYKCSSFNDDTKIYCPIVKSNDVIVSPGKLNKYKVRTFETIEEIKISKCLTFINSGLLVRKDLFDVLGKYDEDIFLDFVDHNFFKNFFKKFDNIKIMNICLEHNLSALNHNSFKSDLNRFKIYLLDFKAYIKKQKGNMIMYWLIVFYRAIRLSYIYKKIDFIKCIRGTK